MRKTTLSALAILAFPTAVFAADVDLDALRAAVEKYKDVNVAL